MGRSTVHYADNETNNTLKRLHNKLRPLACRLNAWSILLNFS